MKGSRFILLFLFSVLFLTACDDDLYVKAPNFEGEVEVKFRVMYHDSPFSIGSVYTDGLGHRIRVDNFLGYFSMINLVKDNGEKTQVRDFYLADFSQENSLSVKVAPASYDNIEFTIGIPVEYNKNVDPTTYPNAHPLSVQGSQGMFWTWNSGYVFTKYEGKADLDGVDGNPLLSPFAFHVGDDPYIRPMTFSFPSLQVKPGEKKIITIVIQANEIIDGPDDQIDISTDYLTHTSGNTALADRVMDNFVNSIHVE